MKKDAAAAIAEQAEQRGWLKFWAGRSISLTDAGQQIAQSQHKRANSSLLRGEVPVQSLRDEALPGSRSPTRALRPVG